MGRWQLGRTEPVSTLTSAEQQRFSLTFHSSHVSGCFCVLLRLSVQVDGKELQSINTVTQLHPEQPVAVLTQV